MLDLSLGLEPSGISAAIRSATGTVLNETRNIISFDGINQYGTLATPWAPGGQGRITLQIKIPDTATNRFLVDGVDSGVGRLLVLIDTADNISAGGLSVTIDGGSTSNFLPFPADNLVHEITISGDMTGLSVEKIFRNYNGSFYTAGNILYAKFEDLSTTVAGTNDLEFDFSSGTSTEAPINEGASNLITYQNYSSDQWATYTQQPNGDWKGKANLVTNGGFDTDSGWLKSSNWTISNGKATSSGVSGGLLYRSMDRPPHYVVSGLISSITGLLELYDGTAYSNSVTTDGQFSIEIENTNLSYGFLTFTASTGTQVVLDNVSVNEVIKLSTAQQNQFYIDQTEAAIAGYKAKHTTGYVTTLDGIDDYVEGPTLTTPTGIFEIGCTFVSDSLVNNDEILSIGKLLIRKYSDTQLRIWPNTDNTQASFTVPSMGDSIHTIVVAFEAGSANVNLVFDGVDIGTVAASGILDTGDNVLRIARWSGFYGETRSLNLSIIDHEAPLPIGQGGNSGFWPLDDADDVARNVLGLDGNGNVIARTGATLDGFGTWNGSPSRELFSLDVATGSLENSYWPNLLQDTGTLNPSTWPTIRASVTTSAGIAPDGESTAILLNATDTTLGGWIRDFVDTDLGDNTFSVYAKAGTLSSLRLNVYDVSDKYGVFDLATGVVSSESGATSAITSVGNGWYRLSITVSTASTSVQAQLRFSTSVLSATDNVLVWHPQFEQGDSVTEYVETTSDVGIELELSTELQRLYDLSIVEAKIAKLDAQFARVQPLLDLDGVDDSASHSLWSSSGDFSISFSFSSTLSSLGIFLGNSASSTSFVYLSATGQITARVSPTEQIASSLSGYNDGDLHNCVFSRVGGLLTLTVDDTNVGSITGSVATILLDQLGQNTFGNFFDGRVSPITFIDYANPSNSRYYMPTATGLVDLLGTGATDGTYNGSPAAPETFYKVGDDWHNLDSSTIITGA